MCHLVTFSLKQELKSYKLCTSCSFNSCKDFRTIYQALTIKDKVKRACRLRPQNYHTIVCHILILPRFALLLLKRSCSKVCRISQHTEIKTVSLLQISTSAEKYCKKLPVQNFFYISWLFHWPMTLSYFLLIHIYLSTVFILQHIQRNGMN